MAEGGPCGVMPQAVSRSSPARRRQISAGVRECASGTFATQAKDDVTCRSRAPIISMVWARPHARDRPAFASLTRAAA